MSGADVALTGRVGRAGDALRCRLVRASLPGELLNTIPMSPSARRHLDTCLSCQAQAARHRSVLRALRSLRDDLEEAPLWLVGRVLARLEAPQKRPDHRAVLAVSAVAASVAVAIAAVRWLRSGS